MILISSILFILFLIWSNLMLKKKLTVIDNKFYNHIKITNLKTNMYKIITTLANGKYIAFLCLLMFIIIKDKTIPILIIINMIITWLLIGLTKNIFKRQRPNINRLVFEKGYSYPSGHTFTSTTFYGFIIFFLIISNLIISLKVIILVFLTIIILLVGYSRIYLGVHYLSDVISSLLLGTTYLLLYIYFTYFILNLL